MLGWQWLTNFVPSWGFVVRVTLKALILFIVLNAAFALVQPLPALGHLTVYNWLVPGRERLPYGETPDAYNLSLNSLDAMFASHAVSAPKAPDEYRVLVFGDSSVWGVLLDNSETLTGQLNALDLKVEGKRMRFYNLGHPILSLTKDLMLMDYAVRRYAPDMILWAVTLESFARDDQLTPPLVQANAPRVADLIARYDLDLSLPGEEEVPDFMDETLIGRRRDIADWWRLQMFGFRWAQTGIDQVYRDYTPRSNDFDADTTWHGVSEGAALDGDLLALDVLAAGLTLAGDVPVLVMNEPIFIADGENSDIRYNFWYPRWAYDAYRALLADFMRGYPDAVYIDAWFSISPSEFTDSPVHLTPEGSAKLAAALEDILADFLGNTLSQ